MAYTDPVDRALSELITPPIWNAEVAANFRAMGPHLIVRKPSDGSAVTTSTFVNDAHLLMAVAANEVWQFHFIVILLATSGDNKVNVTHPSGGQLYGSITGLGAGQVDHAPLVNPSTYNMLGTSNGIACHIWGTFANSTTAGNLQLQTACQTTGNTVVKANSTLWAVKLA